MIEPSNVQSVRLHGNQNTQVFDARPNQRWSIQIRAVNSAGHSPWSRIVNTVTSPPGELIEGLTVAYQQQVPVLSWRSVHGVDELVAAYRVEIQHDYDQSWRPHSSGMVSVNEPQIFAKRVNKCFIYRYDLLVRNDRTQYS